MLSTCRRNPQARRRHGRAAVLWGIALFAGSQLVLRLIVDYAQPELRDPIFEIKYRQLSARLAARPERPATVVFFGSSMTVHAIKAGVIEEQLAGAIGRPALAFNLGIRCSGPLSQQIFVRRLLARGVRPDLAVIELTPLVYDYAAPDDLQLFPGERLEGRELPLVRARADDPAELERNWWQAFFVPIYGNRLAMLNWQASFLIPFSDRFMLWTGMAPDGWVGQDALGDAEHRATLVRVEQTMRPRLGAYQLKPGAMQPLIDLLELLKRERIPSLLLIMPEGPLVRSLYAPGPLAGLFGEFAALSRAYGVPLVNAHDWLEEGMFRDSIHATSHGAGVLSARLGREAIVPLLSTAKRIAAD